MGGLSTISLDPLPQVITGLTPSCSSKEVRPVWMYCTCQTTDTIHKCTVHVHPHYDEAKARESDFHTLQEWWLGNSCNTASITMQETEGDATDEKVIIRRRA